MLMTRSTDKACQAAIRALHSPRPIFHIATDSLLQVMTIMDSAFFHSSDQEDAHHRYVSLSVLRKKNKSSKNSKEDTQKSETGNWLSQVGKKVIHIAPGADHELETAELDCLLEYLEQYQIGRYASNTPVQCRMVVYGKKLKLPPVLEAHTTRIDLPELVKEDFYDILISLYKPDAQEQRDPSFEQEVRGMASWYANQLTGFPENEVIAMLSELLYAKDRKEQLDQLLDKNVAEKIIRREKNNYLKKHGMLECQPSEGDIQGLEPVRKWLDEHKFNIVRDSFEKDEDITKGILLLGLPGTGKSQLAKCCASMLELPLIKLDIGRLLGKYVGESENNMNQALDDLLVAGAPCVLFIDEIEKAYSGAGSEGGGSSVITRLMGKMLTFMQDMKRMVFIIATANDIGSLPPELFRAGRFSQVFSLMLPSFQELTSIMKAKTSHHLGGCTDEQAMQQLEILAGLKKWDRSRLVEVVDPPCLRFLTGADVTAAALEMTTLAGLKPGGGTREDRSDAALYAAMQRYADGFRATVDTHIPFTLEKAAASYIKVLEQGALAANATDAAINAKNYRPDKVTEKAPESSALPQCVAAPAVHASRYDREMFIHIGKAMDEQLRKKHA